MGSIHEQMRRCEECGEFFFVPMIQSNSLGVPQVRLSGPWVCGAKHPSAGEKRRLTRTSLGDVLERRHRVRR
jgi:hypothetical protein